MSCRIFVPGVVVGLDGSLHGNGHVIEGTVRGCLSGAEPQFLAERAGDGNGAEADLGRVEAIGLDGSFTGDCRGEIERRTEAVGIFSNEAAIPRLVGAILLAQNDEWAVQRTATCPSRSSLPTPMIQLSACRWQADRPDFDGPSDAAESTPCCPLGLPFYGRYRIDLL